MNTMTTTTPTATPDRGTTRAGTLLVVAGPGDLPAWVSAWCERTGRRLRNVPADADPAAPPAAPDTELLFPRGEPAGAAPALVVAAVRALPGDAPVLAAAADVAAQQGGSVRVVHAVPLSFGERSVGLDAALRRGRGTLDHAADLLRPTGVPVRADLVRRWPHEVVGEAAAADLIVLGRSPRHRPRPLGPVPSSALCHAPCPVLVVTRGDHRGSATLA